jgi:drug/metabolite transporter (DMT)-like permease
MIITGSSNSLWSKWQDMQCVENCDDPDPHNHVLYEQPVWQTLQMFFGEMLCFLPVLYTWLRTRRQVAPVFLPADSDEDEETKPATAPQRLRGWNLLLLWFPAVCDLTGTTLMNIGLLYTPVSIYQMTRGALVLFVGILSVIFLGRRLWLYQWVSLLTVMAGVSLVGYSGSLIKDAVKDAVNLVTAHITGATPEPIDAPDVTKVLVGVFIILFAQIFTATQFVVEEKIMTRWSVDPLVAVGFEGLFGALTIMLLVPFLAQPSIASRSPFFDFPRGWHQMIDTPSVLWSGLAIACSISLFNYFGLSVTRHVSATARSLTDTCRTLSIWLISLVLGWEKLLFPISLLQVVGFSLLVYGTFMFNNLVNPPSFLGPSPNAIAPGSAGAEEAEAHLASSQLDESAILPVDLGQSGYDVLPADEHVKASGASRIDE